LSIPAPRACAKLATGAALHNSALIPLSHLRVDFALSPFPSPLNRFATKVVFLLRCISARFAPAQKDSAMLRITAAERRRRSKEASLKIDLVTRVALIVIAVCLMVVAFRPVALPAVVEAQSAGPYPFYIEPGYQMLRSPDASQQVLGKMVIDMRNGKVWGFPTLGDSPYPIDITSKTPPTSHPIYLGKFAFGDTEKAKQ